jgi:pimeloyl-ACP methyl ester carboxylesterase
LKKILLLTQVLLCVTLGFSPAPAAGSSAQANSVPPTEFKISPCEYEIPANMVEGVDIQCGFVDVPEDYANPAGPAIELAVAVIKSKQATPEADPLIMEQGGPGGSTIDTFLKQFTYDDRLRANRDIILLEQRGTLNSIPHLMCTELDQLTLDTLEKDLSQEELAQLNLEAIDKCHARLEQGGIDLSAFDSLENATDIESLRIAMGYDQVNLYGVSYGTLLALHYMHLFPDHLRSVILDGVLPPQTNFLLQTTYTIDQSLKKLFASCLADADCNREYPELEQTFFDLVKKLNDTPAIVPLKDPDTGKIYQSLIDGDSFLNGVAQMLYATSIIPALPRVIYEARDGRFDFFARIMELIVFDHTLAYGMYYSVLCAEDADFSPSEQNLSGVDPTVQEVLQRGPEDFLNTCKIWNVTPLGPAVDAPVSSNIPTLLLSGAFDPVTPPDYAQTVANTLGTKYLVTFPAGGHGQAFEGECQDQIILNFLENPAKPPDTSCVQSMGGPDFYSSKNLIDSPVIIGLLNLDRNAVIQFFVLLLSTLFLASAILIIPISGLVRWLSRFGSKETILEGEETIAAPLPILVRTSGWFAFLTSILAVIFLTGLVLSIGLMVTSNDNRLAYGLAGEARPWLIIPPVMLVLVIGWIAGIFQAWKGRAGSRWDRVYHTFLSVNAVAYLTILGIWGLLFALI